MNGATIASVTLCAASLALLGAVLVVALRDAAAPVRTWWRARLAAREDANGHALLRLADEIDGHAVVLHQRGQPHAAQQAWAALCRRIAVDHLACINALLLEPGADAWKLGTARQVHDQHCETRDGRS